MKQTYAVTCASSRMGQAVVRELAGSGHAVRALTRNADVFPRDEFPGVTIADADFADVGSLASAFAGVDAICSAIPSLAAENSLPYAHNLAEAAKQAGVRRVVHNSMMWAPDAPCGQPFYDAVLRIEDVIAQQGLDVTIFRPVLFMDNLLTNYAKPNLVQHGVYRYCQRPGMLATWIAMEDVAQFILAAQLRDDLIGRRIVIGGPETIPVEQVVQTLAAVLGKPITYQYEDPYDWGERVHSEVLHGTVMSRAAYREAMGDFYTFNNHSDYRPFEVDMAPVLAELPVRMSALGEWAERQDWSLTAEDTMRIGSITS